MFKPTILYEMVASHSVNLLLFELLGSIYIVSETIEIVYISVSVYAHGDYHKRKKFMCIQFCTFLKTI